MLAGWMPIANQHADLQFGALIRNRGDCCVAAADR
jgi:hypothetical protein